MDAPGDNTPEILRQSILDDARAEAEQIRVQGADEARRLIADATEEAERARREHLEAAGAEAARRRELLLAGVPVEAGRRRSARAELLLQSIRDDARRGLLAREGVDYHAALAALVGDAVSRMEGDHFVIRAAPADRPQLDDALAARVGQMTGRPALHITVVDDPAMTGGGILVEDAEGHQVCDNRLLVRLDRLWPELRLQIALYAGLMAESAVSREGGS